MTISIFEYGAHDPCSGEPLEDTLVRRRVLQAIANTMHQLGETSPISCVVVSNDDGTTGVRVRITSTNGAGDNAGQGDILIAANSTRTFYVNRKRRTANEATDLLYINGVADS